MDGVFSPKMWDWPLQHKDGMVNVKNTKDKFECELEVPVFNAEEIDVKCLGDELILFCNQEEGHGRREVHRTYHLPHDVDPTSVKTALDNTGHLKVVAMKKK